MSQRDKPSQDRGFDQEPRREPRRRDSPEFDDDVFELPTWGSQQSRAPRDPGARSGSQSTSRPSREPAARSGRPVREPLPTLGDAFRRPNRSNDAAPDDRSPTSTRDPYDRLRGVASRPQRTVQVDEFADPSYDDGGYGDDAYPELPPVPREQTRRRRQAPQPERKPSAPRTPASQQIGGFIAAAAPQTRLVAGVGGFAVLSLVLMAATVAGRMSAVPDWLPIHLNAEGEPDLWGSNTTLWRIPLMTVVLTLMSVGTAWYLWKRDPFAARFTFASTVLIHALSWVALVNLVW